MTISIGSAPPVDRFGKDEHKGHMVLFVSPEPQTMTTQFGEGDAAVCKAVVCGSCRTGWLSVPVFGNSLVPRLTIATDDVVIGILVQGKAAKSGQNPPWLLDDPSDTDLKLAREIVELVLVRGASGRLLVDLAALESEEGDKDEEKF
jgi:hypothetical protein